MIVLNARNGLAFRSLYDTEHVGYFLSTHAHHADHYFSAEAMPLAAIVELLRGGVVCVVDVSSHKAFPDSLTAGLGSWVIAFNSALGSTAVPPHTTDAMRWYGECSEEADRVKRIVRRLRSVYKDSGPVAQHFWGRQEYFRYNNRVVWRSQPESGPAVVAYTPTVDDRIWFDDKPEIIAQLANPRT